MVPFEKSAKIPEQKRYQLKNLRKFGNKNGTIREKYQKSQTKMVPFQKNDENCLTEWYHFRTGWKI